jgi:N-acetylneuraminic acid mutarotase
MRSTISFKTILLLRASRTLGTVLLVICAAASAKAQLLPGIWTVKGPMPAVRGEVAAVAYQDKLYAIGGNVSGNAQRGL